MKNQSIKAFVIQKEIIINNPSTPTLINGNKDDFNWNTKTNIQKLRDWLNNFIKFKPK